MSKPHYVPVKTSDLPIEYFIKHGGVSRVEEGINGIRRIKTRILGIFHDRLLVTLETNKHIWIETTKKQ
jgi:hypothetical protein